MESELDIALIEKATAFLKGKIRQTPIEYSPKLSQHLQVPVYLKLECLQLTGSFKVRGALFYLSTLSKKDTPMGVAACSAGNHGLGIALAAKIFGLACTVYVPKNADRAKTSKIAELGARVEISAFTGYDDTLEWAIEQSKARNEYLVPAFDDERIMAANGGSIAVEIMQQLPDVKNVIVPIGGGGLSAGMAFYLKKRHSNVSLIGVQHQASAGFSLSLKQGKAITKLPAIDTVAGGIEGGIGEKCFAILKDRIDQVALLSEEEIIEGFRWLLQHHQYLAEPSAAVTVASCLTYKAKPANGPTLVLLSGRNVSYETLKRCL